jgi:hypothetical protein
LFRIRPQDCAQTHATFPLLFNAIFLATDASGTAASHKARRRSACRGFGLGIA